LTFAVLTVACAGAPPRFTTSTLSVSSTVSPTNEMVSNALGELRPWQSPLDVAVGADAVWVTVQDLGLVRVDPATGRAVASVPGDYFFRVSVGPDAVWVSTGGDGRVVRIDPSSNAVTASIPMGTGPVGDIAPTADAVWVSASTELLRIDPASNEIVARLRFDSGVGGIAFDETGVWAIVGANREGTAVKIDPDTNRVIDSVPVPNPNFWNDIDAGAGGIWVTTSPIVRQDDVPLVELYRIDPVTRTIEGTVGVGRGTTGLGEGGRVSLAAAATSGDSVWVYNDFERILRRVDGAGNVVVETIPVGSCCSAGLPPGMAVGYGALWVTGDDDLMRVTLFGE
jgi:DNA-binding beta-propeller fold protein YncE